jgi:hypothetical protein
MIGWILFTTLLIANLFFLFFLYKEEKKEIGSDVQAAINLLEAGDKSPHFKMINGKFEFEDELLNYSRNSTPKERDLYFKALQKAADVRMHDQLVENTTKLLEGENI